MQKESVKLWLKDKHHLLLLAALVIGLILRIYYMSLVQEQTLWWDEAEYGAIAKTLLGRVDFDINPQRPFLFPGLLALFFMSGFSELLIKILVSLIPSLALVIVVYLLGKELYSKEVGVIAAFLTAVSWSILFWGLRLQPDALSLNFQVLSFYFIWKYFKNPSTKLIVVSAICASLGFMFKVSGLLVPASLFIFILLREKMDIFRKKDYWIFLGTFIALLIPQFIYSIVFFGNPLALFTDSGYAAAVVTEQAPVAWYTLGFTYSLTENVLFVLFLGGLCLGLFALMGLDIILKDKSKLSPDLLSLIVMLVVAAFYIFYIRGAEDRWVFLWIPFLFLYAGQALMFIYKKLAAYHLYLALLVIAGLLAFGMYSQVSHAHALILTKKDSYSPVKVGALWIKENSHPGDLVITQSQTQAAYYAERPIQHISAFSNASDFETYVTTTRPRFLEVSLFEYHPPWIFSWIDAHQDRLVPVKALYSDEQKQNAVLAIYEIRYNQSISS